MAFAQFNFNPNISKALQMCGYDQPTPIQLRSIPEVLKGEDIVASSQTGSGKTAAFILPSLQRLSLAKSTIKPRVLVLTPTRELAAQIIDAAQKYGKFLRFNMVTLVGGASYRQQLKGLSRPCDIIVATPGRLLDHMQNKKIDLSGIEMLILDEADRMLDMGFIDDVKMISKATPHTRQTLLFSATVDDRLSQIIRQLLKNPVRIDLTTEKLAPVSIKQQLYIADNIQHKNRLLHHFLTKTSIYKAIIFSGTKVNADKLAKDLREEGLLIAPLHGDLKQAVRNRTIEQFRRGKIQYLIATDVASRGLDVPDVTHVINYDLPKFSEDYAHRIGRTGRAGRDGIAISFALPIDARHLQKIERFMGQRLEIATIPGLEATKSMSSSKSTSSRKEVNKRTRDSSHHTKRPSNQRNAKSHSSNQSKRFSDKNVGNNRRSVEDKKYEGRKYNDKPSNSKERSANTGKKHDGVEKHFTSKNKKYSDKILTIDRRSSDSKPFGEKKSFGKSFDEKKSFGKPFDKKKSSGKSFDEKKSFGKPFDKKKSSGKSFDEKKSFGKPFDKKKSSGKPFDKKKSANSNDRKSSFKEFGKKKPTNKPGTDAPFSNKKKIEY